MNNVTALKQTARRRAPRQLRAHLEICSVCGCTDQYACDGGCYWVARRLCSACAETAIAVLEAVGQDDAEVRAASASSLRFLKRMVQSA